MNTKNILIVGVGGQGTLLASKLLGKALLGAGWDVKVSEVHGMSQRGGSVVTYVRYGERVDSPLIERGEADVMLAFEELEAARWLPYLRAGGEIVVNTQRLDPMPVISGQAVYPEGILDTLRGMDVAVTAVDAFGLAQEAGSVRSVNVVLLGKLARRLELLERGEWEALVRATVPPKTAEGNVKAFGLGWEA